MGSYVVKADDICEVIRQIEALKGTATLDYRKDLLNHFGDDEYRRIKWFFYCDDRLGNTLRVFDPHFLNRYSNLLSEKYVFMRGENIGKERQSPKSEMLHLFKERIDDYPRFVNWKGEPKALEYFARLNSNGHNREDLVPSINSNERLDRDLARYQPLVDETFLRHSFFNQMEELLTNYKQVILEGPPGSGKTFVARNFAKWWTNPEESGAGAGSTCGVVQFHESYGYEDFFQGIRPQLLNAKNEVMKASDTDPVSGMVYRNCAGIFQKFCDVARKPENKNSRFVLVIDEINRGKTSRIFGELLYVLEYRDEQIDLASGERFDVPKNVYLIGTMNTADRSIALVDYALRRRFKFVGLRPIDGNDAPVLRSWLKAKAISDVDKIVNLFCNLNKLTTKINPHFSIGHSYFMSPRLQGRNQEAVPEEFPSALLEEIWNYSILPLLSEYEPHRSLDEIDKDYGWKALLSRMKNGQLD